MLWRVYSIDYSRWPQMVIFPNFQIVEVVRRVVWGFAENPITFARENTR